MSDRTFRELNVIESYGASRPSLVPENEGAFIERLQEEASQIAGLGEHVEVPAELQKNVLITTVDALLNWGRRSSVWPLPLGTACCAIEALMATGGSRFDISRFGSELFRSSPRQADLMMVAGTVVWKMAPVIKRLYEQMAEPKYVMAVGGCASSGGPYVESYAVCNGINLIVPVDVYVTGCPPRPDATLRGLMMIQEMIDKKSIADKEGRPFERRPQVVRG